MSLPLKGTPSGNHSPRSAVPSGRSQCPTRWTMWQLIERFWRGHRTTRSAPSPRSRRTVLRLEGLEGRDVPSATLNNGVLSIVGTEANPDQPTGQDDVIVVRRVGNNLLVDEQEGNGPVTTSTFAVNKI